MQLKQVEEVIEPDGVVAPPFDEMWNWWRSVDAQTVSSIEGYRQSTQVWAELKRHTREQIMEQPKLRDKLWSLQMHYGNEGFMGSMPRANELHNQYDEILLKDEPDDRWMEYSSDEDPQIIDSILQERDSEQGKQWLIKWKPDAKGNTPLSS